ncbi:MAG: Rne/Rng family ribonuclease [Actinomycetota bacterium]
MSTSAKRRRRRRRAGGAGNGDGPAAEREGAQVEAPEPEKKKPAATRPKRATPTRTARRRTRTGAGAEKETADGGPTRTRRSQATLRRRESMPVVPRGQDKLMLITQNGERDQIAVVEDRLLVEHYITRSGAKSMVGNIYLGRVQNVLPGMEAAFIDIGKGRNAVLYAGEVSYDEDIGGRQQRIEQVLKPGQAALVQVTKDPIGGKGPRLTQEISVPGRYVVMMPSSDVFGISRRLPDNERRRLRTIIKKVRPEQHGVIVRTAAEGASEDDLAADLKRLAAEWEQISKKAKKAKAPHLLYEEPELTVRVVRDLFNDEEFKEIITDTDAVYAQVRDYLSGVAPELVEKVHLHSGKLPLFEQHHLIEQIHKALERKVWLPSGGYLVIDKTEAMTVIDVNTGKHVGKANLEETVTKTNLEAADEVARQLRLRDIGGMILVDFIDMLLEQNKRQVIDTLKNAMAKDKTRSQVFDISPLGILEITRKRVSGGLLDSFSETCPTCGGRGILITHEI